MYVEKLTTTQAPSETTTHRPHSFHSFIGQEHIVRIMQGAILSAQKNNHQLWHTLISWPSGYGKTTLAQIIAQEYGKKFHIITAYAISQPAELISILTNINHGDVIFIDEIHRLRPQLEEMLYIAMEDYAIDMVMWDGWSVRIPLESFTLIGATTKPEHLSEPLKNRFIYDFHCMDYNESQKILILERYLKFYYIDYDTELSWNIARKVDTIPRKIHNLVVTIRDYLVSHHNDLILDKQRWESCSKWLDISDGGLTPIHQQYLRILSSQDSALGLKTIALKLWINEESVEYEIEPLLLKSWLIEKTTRWRIIKKIEP